MGVIEVRKQMVNEIDYFIQSQIDNFVMTRQKPKFSFYRYLSSENIDKKTIEEFNNTTSLPEVYDEVLAAYKKEDPYLVEAYGNFKKSQLREFTELLNSFLEDAIKYSQDKNVVRIRKKKIIPPEKQVAKLNYCKSFQLKGKTYTSVEPKELINKKVAYVYDYKQNKLSVYYSKGFSVKGTTIIEFDEEKSWSKKIRNANNILDHIIDSSSIGLKNLSEMIKTTNYKPTGRINQNCIIIKVF
jgi:hypothetical protein